MRVETGFGIVDVKEGTLVRFKYHETMRLGTVEYVGLTKDRNMIVKVNIDGQTKTYRADRVESAIEVV